MTDDINQQSSNVTLVLCSQLSVNYATHHFKSSALFMWYKERSTHPGRENGGSPALYKRDLYFFSTASNKTSRQKLNQRRNDADNRPAAYRVTSVRALVFCLSVMDH